jgi:hypothetical protein
VANALSSAATAASPQQFCELGFSRLTEVIDQGPPRQTE